MSNELNLNRKGLLILIVILIVVGITQAQNIFQFPYYQDVEGTNIANAWSIVNTGELSPYTYAYEDPPAGSFLISFWMLVNQATDLFDSPLALGRALMLVMHLITLSLIFGIARKVSNSNITAAATVLIFAFSPLAITLQRRVILDNIMLVWLLLALYQILGEKRTLTDYLLSATFFGMAVLTKGAALFFMPAFIYIIRLQSDQHHKRFAVNLWIAFGVCLIAFYPLYAQMKQELFPQGWLFGGDFPHVSLVEQILDRGPDTGRFLNMASGLETSFDLWVDLSNVSADPVLIYVGLIGCIFMIVLSIDNKKLRPIVATTACCGLYILFGGPVFDSHAITLLPFLAMNIGVAIGLVSKMIGRIGGNGFIRYVLTPAVLGVLLYPFWMFYSNRIEVYTLNQVEGQIAALDWVQNNVPSDAVVVTDNYAFVELRETHPNTQHYWRVDTDPQIKFLTLNDDVCSIDYMITSPQVLADTETFNLDLVRRTVENSSLLFTFENNGWPIEIRQVSKVNCLQNASVDSEEGLDS
jgi:4-amino-4-deoxy-L-arabinose transferase-like glycosyltransferase